MNNDIELWKDIENYESLYQVSNFGNVRSLDKYINSKSGSKCFRKGKLMKLLIGNDKYYKTIYLQHNKVRKLFSVHRLVAKTFIKNPENKPFVNHKDGVKYNNFSSNLEWCTRKENVEHAIKTGLLNQKGEKHSCAKFTNLQVIEIKRLLSSGIKQVEIAKKFNVSKQVINCIKKEKSWKNIN